MFLEIRVRPLSPFGSAIKGDTLFGHFCWQIAVAPELLKRDTLDDWIDCYSSSPFAIFSSAWLRLNEDDSRYVLRRPELPPQAFPSWNEGTLEDRILRHKKERNRYWMVLGSDLKIDLRHLILKSSRELSSHPDGLAPFHSTLQAHNTIHRTLGSTAKDAFAPFAMPITYHRPETRLSLFAWINPDALDIERVRKGLERIGQFGYGRDASTGCGRFRIEDVRELEPPPTQNANACYALSPVLPERNAFGKIYHRPFVRFGRHGDALARASNPYKNPVLMADEGAVLVPKSKSTFKKPYLGRPVTRGLSLAQPKTVLQGYSLYLPFQLEAA